MRVRMLGAVGCLLAVGQGFAAPDTLISIDLADVPFAAAVSAIAEAGEMKVVLSPLVPEPGRVTVSFANIAAQSALERLLRVQPNLVLESFDDVIIIRAKPVAEAAPTPPPTMQEGIPPRPSVQRPGPQMGGPGPVAAGPSAATGVPVMATRRYERIEVHYMYAPGLAQVLGGRGLRLSDIDPWVGAMAASAGAGQSGFVQGQGSGFGGGGFGGNQTQQAQGRAVFDLPNGIDELVGTDWGTGMVAR